IQGVVNRELQQIFGENEDMDDLPPEKRGKVMEVVDELGETLGLEVLILVDTSASMKAKLPTVQDALVDLSLSLSARSGANQFSLYTFPGKRKDTDQILDWSPKIGNIQKVLSKLSSGGVTPTGPAIRDALSRFKRSKRSLISTDESFIEESGS
ncbi:MAG TPA: vWA domain-containing protein, partial [Bacillales bacterium]|nr:vWA domain-containing protein [Bacillales bacterium]